MIKLQITGIASLLTTPFFLYFNILRVLSSLLSDLDHLVHPYSQKHTPIISSPPLVSFKELTLKNKKQ